MSLQYLHSMIRVRNLDSALDFFVTKLGLVETYRKEVPAGRFTLVFLAAPHDLELAQSRSAPLLELTWNWDDEDYDGVDGEVTDAEGDEDVEDYDGENDVDD